MKRSTLFLSVALSGMLVVLGVLAVGMVGRGASAQDATTEGHPLVGTWIANTDPAEGSVPHDVFIFDSDGTYIEQDADGATQLGAWAATGPTTATLTVVAFEAEDEDGTVVSSYKIRATIEVGADGNSFTAQYTLEFIDSDGTSTGEVGPGTATGTRLVVEAPGTPVMTMDDLFSSFEGEDEGAPEATPAA